MITVKSKKWTPELVETLHALLKQEKSEALQQIDCVLAEKMPVYIESNGELLNMPPKQ